MRDKSESRVGVCAHLSHLNLIDRMEWQGWCKSISSWVLMNVISKLREAVG
jgi:hypothetical protein